ncbi:uncharacterized protein LOC117646338 [Thrips palmi]|uniref:Uncharacterized protein LOC117646338 n=1 Tax=Thrips palmi TaxID=161013 RepID=A0A6P8YSU6_THRPL|nr:uncharacterized protein LOC117646338 [Thrips palmi]
MSSRLEATPLRDGKHVAASKCSSCPVASVQRQLQKLEITKTNAIAIAGGSPSGASSSDSDSSSALDSAPGRPCQWRPRQKPCLCDRGVLARSRRLDGHAHQCLGFGQPLGQPSHPYRQDVEHRGRSFSLDQMWRIERENQDLLRRLRACRRVTPPSVATPIKITASSAINRTARQRQIDRENMVIRRRLQDIEQSSSTLGLGLSAGLREGRRGGVPGGPGGRAWVSVRGGSGTSMRARAAAATATPAAAGAQTPQRLAPHGHGHGRA